MQTHTCACNMYKCTRYTCTNSISIFATWTYCKHKHLIRIGQADLINPLCLFCVLQINEECQVLRSNLATVEGECLTAKAQVATLQNKVLSLESQLKVHLVNKREQRMHLPMYMYMQLGYIHTVQ